MLRIPVLPRRVALLLAVGAFAACSPTLDWRELRPEGSGLVALFPCKPTVETRTVVLEGLAVRLNMHACQAGGSMYAVATGEIGDPARVAPVLNALLAAQAGNLSASVSARQGFSVSGATPQAPSFRVTLSGRLPDGSAVFQEAAFFTRGARVFQAMVMGPRRDAEASTTFFESFELPS